MSHIRHSKLFAEWKSETKGREGTRIPCAKRRVLERDSFPEEGRSLLWQGARRGVQVEQGEAVVYMFYMLVCRYLPTEGEGQTALIKGVTRCGLYSRKITTGLVWEVVLDFVWFSHETRISYTSLVPFWNCPVEKLWTLVLGQNRNWIKEERHSRKIWEENLSGLGDWIGNVGRGRGRSTRKLSSI